MGLSMVTRLAVIGEAVDKSLSPFLFKTFGDIHDISIEYEKINVSMGDFSRVVKSFFQAGGLGLNVTAPYKPQAFNLATVYQTDAKAAKAGNVLYMQSNQLAVASTDGFGLICSLNRHVFLKNASVLLIGSGGAAKSVIPSLIKQGANITLAARDNQALKRIKECHPAINISHFQALTNGFDVIINATNASQKGEVPTICGKIIKSAFCLDMVYQPRETVFQKFCLSHGAKKAIDGYEMLIYQAAKSFELWFGFYPDTTKLFKDKPPLLSLP